MHGPILFALLGGTAFAGGSDRIDVHNALSACVTVKTTKISTDSNIVSASTDFRLLKPIGACGCFSALASYTSSVDGGGVRQRLQEGTIGLKSSGQKTLVLASEPARVAGRVIRVRLTCARPL
ncbi:MAG: DUF2195 family protein [Phyllobacterium sp.]